ncbi:hypothetical protein JHD50_05585 [Sulfurimonas sp. MAG313]|nr:hypothetical protein [Sulfurimonas sp. MAG313]MDF1880780.1 hypothetical protein [Sulfurimonas sp. MAG313]
MSKSLVSVIIIPFVLLALIMQVHNLWGWLMREGWIQYLMMAEVYALFLITMFYLRFIVNLKNTWVNFLTIFLIPSFYFIFSNGENSVGSIVNSLWYINILISVMASTWMSVFVFGVFWLLKKLMRYKVQKEKVLAFGLLVLLSVAGTYLIKMSQLPEDALVTLWNADKLRTIWFMLEPIIVLCFSFISIYLYILKIGMQGLKQEYVLMVLVLISFSFEYMINGFGLVSARTVVYFVGIYCFIRILENRTLAHYFLVSAFIILVSSHLGFYSAAPHFFEKMVFVSFLHNALIESIKMFIALYVFILGWSSVKIYKSEFRLIMVLVSLIAYTYTTQSQSGGVHFYDIVAITAMLKLTSLYMIVLYGFYYFNDKTSESRTKSVSSSLEN